MTLHINEAEVRQLLTMPMAIAAVEEVSRKQAEGSVVVHPRRRFELPQQGFFHYMAAMDSAAGFVGMKQYTYVKGKLRFLVPLYSAITGELLALIEADYMGQQRTGAASGVATKYLARKLAKVAAIIGTGGQGRTQLEAIHNVRMLDSVYVYGRDAGRRNQFSEEMAEKLSLNVYAVESAAAAVSNAEIICTATTSPQPVLLGEELAKGVHINAIGANHAHKQELDEAAVAKSSLIFVDSLAQSQQEAGDLIVPFSKQPQKWASVRELSDLVAGKAPGRANDAQITLFKSNGIAAWDLAVAEKVYALAKEKGLGRELPLYTSS
jgi:ornithine cyclodeaminase/alanine dehydrogenase-like protein (mu-crystallin family)